MASLSDILMTPETRPKVVRACEDLVSAEVAQKPGLSGAAIKAAYKIVKAIQPGLVGNVIDHLLPEFAGALEPMHVRSRELAASSGRRVPEVFEEHLHANDTEAAEALLGVTDRRIQSAKNQTLRKTYERLRGSARDHVRGAVPGLARTLAPFL